VDWVRFEAVRDKDIVAADVLGAVRTRLARL
jgi:hypothetical protein